MGMIYSTELLDPQVVESEAEELIETSEFWSDLPADQAAQLARAVREVDAAIDGDAIALQAVLSAVARIRESALREVMDK